MDGKYEYEKAQGAYHYQRFDGFKSSYDEFTVAIPRPSNGSHNNNNVTKNYAKQIGFTNRDPNYTEEQVSSSYEDREKWRNLVIHLVIVLPLVVLLGNGGCFLFYYVTINSAAYYLEPTDNYKIPMKTQEYGIEFYVKSIDKFNKKYPDGSHERAQIEETIINDYKDTERGYCYHELLEGLDYPGTSTPECDKLKSLGIPIYEASQLS